MTISKKQGEKKRKDVKETYELSVRLKRIFGKSKLELVLQMFEENHPECVIYESYVEKLISYLREKYQVCNSCRYLPIPEYFKMLQSEEEAGKCKMMISRNPIQSQYKVADFQAEFKVDNRSRGVCSALEQGLCLTFQLKLLIQPIRQDRELDPFHSKIYLQTAGFPSSE